MRSLSKPVKFRRFTACIGKFAAGFISGVAL